MDHYFEIEKILTGTLPAQVYVLPVVDKQSNVTVKLGSGAASNPTLTVNGKLITVTGKYLRIKINFIENDSIRKIMIFKISGT